MKNKNKSIDDFGFIRVAAAVPPLKIADIDYNVQQILKFVEEANRRGAQIIVFPELSITGYTLGDLLQQRQVLERAKAGLNRIKIASRKLDGIILVGLPLECDSKLFNVAAVISKGKILGFVPKTHIPNYKEFYEERWFASAKDLKQNEIEINGAKIPIGIDILFRINKNPQMVLGIEICEDLWAPVPPSSSQTLSGATIIANLSASNELVGKADYRRGLIVQQSARCISGYVYSSCGVYESTTDLVFGGHALIAENGAILIESKRFVRSGELIISDIDVEHLFSDREKMSSFEAPANVALCAAPRFVDVSIKDKKTASLIKFINPYPFVPAASSEIHKRAEEIFAIQTAGFAKRLEYSGLKKVVVGISGGLDSTLALLVATRACQALQLPLKNIYAFTMPGFATTKRTKSNAVKLAHRLGINLEEIDITEGCSQHFQDINHDSKKQDLVFQNVQARYRTMILMNKANQLGALVLGTGDLSEIALGWCTFTGDHISHYNVNAGVPKTLIKYLISWASTQKEFSNIKTILKDILSTPISPELVGGKSGAISQKTEALIGPYELHDFFLYHFIRWGSSPKKILFLAEQAFGEKYSRGQLNKWLRVFIERFFGNQWKRSVMPDGPKVGSVSLSPRGDWRMPSDAEVKIWLDELDS